MKVKREISAIAVEGALAGFGTGYRECFALVTIREGGESVGQNKIVVRDMETAEDIAARLALDPALVAAVVKAWRGLERMDPNVLREDLDEALQALSAAVGVNHEDQ